MSEVWADGQAYEAYVGRWSRPVAGLFLDWLDRRAGLRWLDVGCGTGALTTAIVAQTGPSSVVGVDRSPAYVGLAAATVADPRVRFEVADADRLPALEVDVVVSGLVLNFLPDPVAVLTAMRSVAPRGAVAAYVWDYADGMELLRRFWDAAIDTDPGAARLDEGARFPLCRRDRLAELWQRAGLTEVRTTGLEIPMRFDGVDALWSPFLGGQGPAPGYVRGLDDAGRQRLLETLAARLPIAADGSISLSARAWAVAGTVP